jgi:hypothetical protein
MKHYDEHTLDLFAMGSEKVANQREEFEQHLKECSLCRDFYAEIKEFYEITNNKNKYLKPKMLPAPGLSLVGRAGLTRKSIVTIMKNTRNLPVILFRVFLKKPVISTFGLATTFGLIYLLSLQINLNKDKNPSYLHYNTTGRVIEVYNIKHDRLWEIKLAADSSILLRDFNDTILNSHSKIVDLNRDGKNEIVTTFQYISDGFEAERNILHIYDYEGKLKLRKVLGEMFEFRGEQFPDNFQLDELIVDDITNSGNMEILIECNNYHSPFFLARLDRNGNMIGEYWHYGHLIKMLLLNYGDDRGKELILAGCEDIDKKACIVVLDPSKIIGKTEATSNRGFGFNPSSAEKYYIKFPNPKEVSFLEKYSRTHISLIFKNPTSLGFEWCLSCYHPKVIGKYSLEFTYYLSYDMKPVIIKPTDLYYGFYSTLLSERKIKKLPDSKYFDYLKNQIEYWDGNEWKKEWSVVDKAKIR